MKVLFLAGLMIIFLASVSGAVDLISDPCIDCVSYDLEVNGVVVENKLPLEADKSIKYNLDGFASGNHTFKARCYSTDNWPSEWSAPYGATKPTGPGNVRIQFP